VGVEDDRLAVAGNLDFGYIEAKLLRQADGLRVSRAEHFGVKRHRNLSGKAYILLRVYAS
jgi:hypothetical protein